MSVPERPQDEAARIDVQSGGRSFVIDTGKGANDDAPDPRDPSVAPYEPPEREEGDIQVFSDDSRRRLRERIHAMRRDAPALFITLTYHERDPHPREAKKDLDRWWKKMKRIFPRISAIWKMEPQERGVPHFHLIVYGIDYIDAQWLSATWHGATVEASDAHAKAGVDVEECLNEDGKIQSYLAKYFAETYRDVWENPGRWWGCLGRDELPWAQWETCKYIDRADAQRIIADMCEAWDVDLPDGVSLPSLKVHTMGDPYDWIDDLLAEYL